MAADTELPAHGAVTFLNILDPAFQPDTPVLRRPKRGVTP
jgi:hypothetical protein